jgi:hypothetical protein
MWRCDDLPEVRQREVGVKLCQPIGTYFWPIIKLGSIIVEEPLLDLFRWCDIQLVLVFGGSYCMGTLTLPSCWNAFGLNRQSKIRIAALNRGTEYSGGMPSPDVSLLPNSMPKSQTISVHHQGIELVKDDPWTQWAMRVDCCCLRGLNGRIFGCNTGSSNS